MVEEFAIPFFSTLLPKSSNLTLGKKCTLDHYFRFCYYFLPCKDYSFYS